MLKRYIAKKEAQKASKTQLANQQMDHAKQTGFTYGDFSQHAEISQQAFIQQAQSVIQQSQLVMQQAAILQYQMDTLESISREMAGNMATVRRSRQTKLHSASAEERPMTSNQFKTRPLSQNAPQHSYDNSHETRKLMKQIYGGGKAPTIKDID